MMFIFVPLMAVVYVVAGLVIIVMGLHFLGIFKISWLYATKRVDVQSKPPGVYIAMSGQVFEAGAVRKNRAENRFETT